MASHTQNFIKVGSISDLPPGSMQHIEVEGKEILLVNLEGNIYALSDRCGHMSAPLSEGELENGCVRCPIHKAEFDIKTGKLVKPPQLFKLISKSRIGKIMAMVKTYDLPIYRVKVENEEIFIGF